MDRQDFKDLEKWFKNLRFDKPQNERCKSLKFESVFRTTMQTFLVSHGIRPAFGFEQINRCLTNPECLETLNAFFEERNLPLKGNRTFVYNTKLLTTKQIKQKS